MTIALIAPGHPMMLAPGKAALLSPLSGIGSSGTTGSGNGGPVTSLSVIAGLSGWWDAGTPADILDPTGAALTAFGAAIGSLADKSGTGAPLTVYHQASSGGTAPIATPRLNGLLGGVGRNTVVPPTLPASGQQLPRDGPRPRPDQRRRCSVGSGSAWTLFLVWSRPNWRQASTAASTLLSIDGTAVLAADNTAGSSRLVLFPGAQQTVLTTTLTRRHTHAVILRNNAGSGVDVWLDATQVATPRPIRCPRPSARRCCSCTTAAPMAARSAGSTRPPPGRVRWPPATSATC